MEQCVTINRLAPDALKRYYKELLKKPREDGQIGGGVGLVSVVRKAENPLEAYTTDIDENHTFLVLSVQVNKHSVYLLRQFRPKL